MPQATKKGRRTREFYEALRVVNSAAESDGTEIANRNFNLETIEGMLDSIIDPEFLEKASTSELDDLVAAYFKTTVFSLVKQMDIRCKAAMHAHRGHKEKA